MSRPGKRWQGWPTIEDRGVTYLFGQGGYIEWTEGDMPIARILVDKFKVRTQDFSEKEPGVQEIKLTWPGLDGMCTHLRVSNTVAAQKRLLSYKKVFQHHPQKTEQKQGDTSDV